MDTSAASKLEQTFLQPFIQGATNTLSTMANLTPALQCIEHPGSDHFSGDVSAVMGLTGDHTEGFVGISFSEELAGSIVSAVLKINTADLEAGDIQDGVGELINMIAGSAKNALLGTSLCFRVALPSVTTGRGHEVGYPKNATCWKATLVVDNSEFDLHVAYVHK